MQRIAQIGAAAARRIFQNRHQQRGAGDRIRIVSCGTEQRRKAGIAAQLRHAPSQRIQQAVAVQCPQPGQLLFCRVEVAGGRFIQPLQLPGLCTAPLQEIQPQRGEIAVEDLRFTLRRRTRGLLLRQ